MDERTFECLQFAEILRLVAEHCQSPLGREAVESSRPADSFEAVQARLAPTAEAMDLFNRGQELSLDGLGDPRPIWSNVGPVGHALEGEELLRVAGFLETVQRAENFLRQVRAHAPHLARLGDGLTPSPVLERDIREAINPDGTVADRASPALARVRADIRHSEQRIRAQVDRLVEQFSGQGLLQDAFATLRDARYVFPVKAAAKNRVQGIVHGTSKTGETLFIEPAVLVTMSNDLEERRQEESREAARVRVALTDRIRPFLAQLRGDTERLANLDSVWGRARAARRYGWNVPHLQERVALRLLDVHHPLLHIRNKAASIGVRLAIEPDDRVIVITGPNAGGKTTLLKTLGLAVLLLQSGIPAPLAVDSRLPVFNEIWADIGDAQDVASGQSTFSAHANRLARILTRARERSLVLLDELGTATDPSEGAALAEAVLDILRRRGGLTLATSHLTPLKKWAHDSHGSRNASFALDPRTHHPTFTLMLDVPGTSEAFVIAEREGIPDEVLDLARGKLDRGEVELGELLRTLGHRERTLAQAEADLRRRLDALAQQEELARQRAETFREERRRFREDAARQREKQIARLREEVETRIAALPAREATLDEQRRGLSQARREAQQLQREAEDERRRAEQSLPPALTREELAPGRTVYVIDLHETGDLLALTPDGRKAQVALGRGLVVEVAVDGLSRPPEEAPAPAPYRGTEAGPAVLPDDDLAASEDASGKKKKASRKIRRQEALAKEQDSGIDAILRGTPRRLDWKPGRLARPEASKGKPQTATAPRPGGITPAPVSPGGPKTPSAAASSDARGGGTPGGPAPGGPSLAASPGFRFSRKPSVPWQIDLHGMRAEEAIEIVDKYLDDAVVADLPYVKLCHGQGTGRLARAIREFLASHPHVRAWRFGQPEEGGAGVTIVDLQ